MPRKLFRKIFQHTKGVAHYSKKSGRWRDVNDFMSEQRRFNNVVKEELKNSKLLTFGEKPLKLYIEKAADGVKDHLWDLVKTSVKDVLIFYLAYVVGFKIAKPDVDKELKESVEKHLKYFEVELSKSVDKALLLEKEARERHFEELTKLIQSKDNQSAAGPPGPPAKTVAWWFR